MFQYPLQSLEEFLLWQQLLHPFILPWMDALAFPHDRIKVWWSQLKQETKEFWALQDNSEEMWRKNFQSGGQEF